MLKLDAGYYMTYATSRRQSS